MILKAITVMNTCKIRQEHGHPPYLYFTRFDQITKHPIEENKMPNLTAHQSFKIIGMGEAGFNMQKLQDASVSTDLLLEEL